MSKKPSLYLLNILAALIVITNITHGGCPESTSIEIIGNKALEELKKGNLVLLDGMPGNNQCHINALIIADIYNQLKTNPDFENTLLKEDKEYLAFNLLFSSALNKDSNNKKKQLVEQINNKIITKKYISNQLGKSSRDSLGGLTLKKLYEFSQNLTNESTINEKLKFILSKKISCPGENLAKFPSILLFLKINQEKNIPIVLRLKHICDHKTQICTFLVKDDKLISYDEVGIDENQALVVIDAVAINTNKEASFEDLKELRDKCAHNFNYKNNNKLTTEHSCPNCYYWNTNTGDCTCIEKWKQNICSVTFSEFMYALAADFTKNLQADLIDDTTPIKDLYEKYQTIALEKKMCSANIKFLFIEHMYAALKKHLTLNRYTDTTSEETYNNLNN